MMMMMTMRYFARSAVEDIKAADCIITKCQEPFTFQEPQETTQAPIIDEPVTEEQPKIDTPAEEPTTEVNSTPMDIPDVTAQPESASNEPDATLPTTESNDESNTEVPESTSATPEISDSTDVQSTETENPTTEASVTEESSTVTDLPEILSTTEETINEESTDDNIEAVTTVGPEVDETELEGGDSEVSYISKLKLAFARNFVHIDIDVNRSSVLSESYRHCVFLSMDAT